MKKIWLGYFLVISILTAFVPVFASHAPYGFEEEKRFKALEAGTSITLPSGDLLVGNASGKASAQSITGNVTISNGGVTTIGAGQVLESMLNGPSNDGLNAMRVARFVYDFGVSGGADGTITLDATLPAHAIVTQSYFYVVTQETGTSGATTSFTCGSATLLAATDETGSTAGSIIAGAQTGTAANMASVGSSACTMSVVLATHPLTAGKILGYAQYVVAM